MKQLFENWRKHLSESSGREMDTKARLLSKEVVYAIKDEDLREYFNSRGKVAFKLDTVLLDKMRNVRDMYVTLYSVNPDDWDPSTAVAGKYEYTKGGDDEERKTSDLYIMIKLPRKYEFNILSHLIPEIKEAIRHELEHSVQETEVLDWVQERMPEGEIWQSIQGATDYYTSESETKAHAVGLYLKSKELGEPFHEVLDDYLTGVYYTGMGYDFEEEELKPLILRMRDWWAYYIDSRYPLSDTGERG
jgi:hypothetical protein